MRLEEIPEAIQTDFLTETESDVMPQIRREKDKLFFPAFVRQETRMDEMTGEPRTIYRYFDVEMPYTGQDIGNEQRCRYQCYAGLRKYFYGPWNVQMEQQLKGTFAAHQYAVKVAFPKFAGESLQEVNRFRVIFTEFWQTVDEATASVGKTRADLPEVFNAEEMLAWARSNGMPEQDIAEYAQIFSVISLNLLQNGRNWGELFQ